MKSTNKLKDKKYINKKEREWHLPGYCRKTSLESAGRDEKSQVGVALFPSYLYIFYHFTFPGFPFKLINKLKEHTET